MLVFLGFFVFFPTLFFSLSVVQITDGVHTSDSSLHQLGPGKLGILASLTWQWVILGQILCIAWSWYFTVAGFGGLAVEVSFEEKGGV